MMGAGSSRQQKYRKAYSSIRSTKLANSIDKLGRFLKMPIHISYDGLNMKVTVGNRQYTLFYNIMVASNAESLFYLVINSQNKTLKGQKDIPAWYPANAYILTDIVGGDIYKNAKELEAFRG